MRLPCWLQRLLPRGHPAPVPQRFDMGVLKLDRRTERRIQRTIQNQLRGRPFQKVS